MCCVLEVTFGKIKRLSTIIMSGFNETQLETGLS
jgi:hypothetical protein